MTRAQLQERLTQDFLAANAANEPCDAFLTAMQSLNGWDEHARLPAEVLAVYPDLDAPRSAALAAQGVLDATLQRAIQLLKLSAPGDDAVPPTRDEFNRGLAMLSALSQSGPPDLKAELPGLVAAALARWLVDSNALDDGLAWLPLSAAKLAEIKRTIEQRTATWKLLDPATALHQRVAVRLQSAHNAFLHAKPAMWDAAAIHLEQAEALMLELAEAEQSTRQQISALRAQLAARSRTFAEASALARGADTLLDTRLIVDATAAVKAYRAAVGQAQFELPGIAETWDARATEVASACAQAYAARDELQHAVEAKHWGRASELLKNLADAGWVGHAQPGDLEANTLATYGAVVAQQRIWLANHSPSEVLGEWPADLAGLNSRGEWVPALDARRRAFVADLQAWYDRANVDQPSGGPVDAPAGLNAFENDCKRLEGLLTAAIDAKRWPEIAELYDKLAASLSTLQPAPMDAKARLERIGKLKQWYGQAVVLAQLAKTEGAQQKFKKTKAELLRLYSSLDASFQGRTQWHNTVLINLKYGH